MKSKILILKELDIIYERILNKKVCKIILKISDQFNTNLSYKMNKLFVVFAVFLFTFYYNFQTEAAPTNTNASTNSGMNSTGEGLTILLRSIGCPGGKVLIGETCYKIVDIDD